MTAPSPVTLTSAPVQGDRFAELRAMAASPGGYNDRSSVDLRTLFATLDASQARVAELEALNPDRRAALLRERAIKAEAELTSLRARLSEVEREYPSTEAMAAAVEIEVYAALGSQTVGIGRAIDPLVKRAEKAETARDEAVEALRPFADNPARRYGTHVPDDTAIAHVGRATVGDVRRAAAIVAKYPPKTGETRSG